MLQLYPDLRPNLKSGPLLDASEEALAPLRSMLASLHNSEGEHGVITAMMLAWSSIHGFISLELGGHFHGSIEDTASVFAALLEQLASQLLSD